MRHQTIAVIGGSGFIGSHLVNALVEVGKHVRIATRRRENAAHLTLLPVDVLETDIYDPVQLAAFVSQADAVINHPIDPVTLARELATLMRSRAITA